MRTRVPCANCGAALLTLWLSEIGTRVMRSYGARVIAAPGNPGTAYIHCCACNALTPVRRNLLPGAPVPAGLFELLEKEGGRERAHVVLPRSTPPGAAFR